MTGLVRVDRRIGGYGRAVVAELCVRTGVARVSVVGVDHMTRRATRVPIITRLIVRAHEPRVRIVEPRLRDVDQGDGDSRTGAWTSIGLADVGSTGLLESLKQTERVRQPGFGE